LSFSDSLQYIQFYPTLRCNLSCTFCFNRGIESAKDISTKDFVKIISILAAIGVGEIDILGGEPTLHSDLSQIVDLICKQNLKVLISSNGFNVQLLKKLSEPCVKENIQIGISLNYDPPSEELHEYIIKYKPLLKSVFSKKQAIPEHAMQYLRLPDIRYYLLFMDTIDKDDLKAALSFPEFFQRIVSLKNNHKNVEAVFCSGFIPDIQRYPVLRHVRCPAGTTKLTIMPDGSVYPCYLFARHNNFLLGNILYDNFTRIWKNPVLNFFRKFEKNNCINPNCELFSSCHGGCPAVSLLVSGDIAAPDPRCVRYR